MLRELHVQRVATRLGLAAQDLEQLATASAQRNQLQGRQREQNDDLAPPSASDRDTQNTVAAAPLKVEPTIELLCLVLLHSTEARLWLLEEDWRAQLHAEPQGEIVEQILERSEHLDAPETLHRFLSSLPPEVEAFAATLLDKMQPQHPLAVAQDCWSELERRQIRRQMETTKAKQRNPALSLEEMAGLHQQILDLQRRLMDIARPFSPLR